MEPSLYARDRFGDADAEADQKAARFNGPVFGNDRTQRDARYACVTNALKFVFLTRRASALASAKNTGKTARRVCLRLCRAVRLTVV